MSAWRRVAAEKLPKQRELIERSESVGMLWVDLWGIFVLAHREPVDNEAIRGVYEFAKWTCTESGATRISSKQRVEALRTRQSDRAGSIRENRFRERFCLNGFVVGYTNG